MRPIASVNTGQTNSNPPKLTQDKTDDKPTVDALIDGGSDRWLDIPQVNKIDEHSQQWLKQASTEKGSANTAEKPLTDETVKQIITAYKRDPDKSFNALLTTLNSGYNTALKQGNLYSRELKNYNRFQNTVIPTGPDSFLAIEQSAGSETFNTAPESAVSVARFKNNQILEHVGFTVDKGRKNNLAQAVQFKDYNTDNNGGYWNFEQMHWNKHNLLKKIRASKAQSQVK